MEVHPGNSYFHHALFFSFLGKYKRIELIKVVITVTPFFLSFFLSPGIPTKAL